MVFIIDRSKNGCIFHRLILICFTTSIFFPFSECGQKGGEKGRQKGIHSEWIECAEATIELFPAFVIRCRWLDNSLDLVFLPYPCSQSLWAHSEHLQNISWALLASLLGHVRPDERYRHPFQHWPLNLSPLRLYLTSTL